MTEKTNLNSESAPSIKMKRNHISIKIPYDVQRKITEGTKYTWVYGSQNYELHLELFKKPKGK